MIGQLSDSVEDEVDNLLADGVVTTGVVVGGILLSSDELFRVEKLSVSSGSDLIDDSRLQIDKDGTAETEHLQ